MRRERENRKKVFEEMVNFFPNLMTIINTQIQEALGITRRGNVKKRGLRYITINLIKTSNKQKNLKVPERKDKLHSKEKKDKTP